MDLRTHYPYSLLKNGILNSYPSLNKNIRTHTTIIGAGITGALIAWHLYKQGIDFTIVDKRHIAAGSTAASTSLIQYEIDTPLQDLIKKVGYRQAIRSYQLCRKAIEDLKQVCIAVKNKDNFEDKCSLQFASFKKDGKRLEIEYKLRKEHGFNVDFFLEKEINNEFGFSAPAALYSYEAAQVDAYVLTHKILQAIYPDNPSIYDHTNIVSIKNSKNNIQLVTKEGHTITTRHLIIACGYESGNYLPRKIENLRCTYAIVSEPLNQTKFWKDNCLIWETANPYLYMRTTPDHRILIGGKDTKYFHINKQLLLLPQKAKALQLTFQKLFPQLSIKVDFQWAGAFGTTKDGLPYIGTIPELPNTHFALGYGGNGITFSLIAAQIISTVIKSGKHPDMDLFSFNR
jgi:glycine/D-amino acid oxidase-like deaminating enzyme